MTTDSFVRAIEKIATIASDRSEFLEKLATSRQLTVKYGIDPTSPDVHLGHTVPLRILRLFQQAGHQAVLIIGDYTARIGDPSGKNESRPSLTGEQITKNMIDYKHQISKFIDLYKTRIAYNSTWFYGFSSQNWLALTGMVTVQQMLVRDDFKKRYSSETPICLNEFLYPLMQAHDSVQIEADVELGGTEQLFNLMLGRDLQRIAGQVPQTCITVPILRGLDGDRKMGKSLDNYIGVSEPPFTIFSKVMSVPDTLIPEWVKLIGTEPYADEKIKNFPRECKLKLATDIVTQCYNPTDAHESLDEWDKRFVRHQDPTDIPIVEIDTATTEICPLLVKLGLATSNSAARRLIVPNSGVTIGTQKDRVTDPKATLLVEDGLIVRVGKRNIVKVKLRI